VSAADLTKGVDQATINRWGELSGDHNPLHVDPAVAAKSRYGRTILHGHLTIAWLSEWGVRTWGAAWIDSGQIENLRFRAPLHADVEYQVRGDVDASGREASVTVVTPDGTDGVTATLRLRER
jgi:3-hydroxybutyryl-CoA dehydratase